MTFYNRKSPRIPNYDYSNVNYYFITICTKDRKCYFGSPYQLSKAGQIAKRHIEEISDHYGFVKIDKYVVMPNHVHMILYLEQGGKADAEQVIGQYKSGVSREIRKIYPEMQVWQRSFHDHVIRNQASYEKIWLYIEGNPQCWDKDCFYTDVTAQSNQV